MPASPVPFVHPNQITFHSRQGPQTEQFCVYNPFPYDVVFKADNPDPSNFCLSLTQGLVSSSNKIYIDLTCTSGVTALDGVLQVRFYRCFRSRHGPRHHGQKNHVQQYVGFREIKLSILTDHSEARTSPEEGIASLSTSGLPDPLIGSNLDSEASRSSARRIKVLTNLIVAILLLLSGGIISQADETWFATNIGGVTTQTCAVVSYTLAGVLLIRVMTIR